MENKEVAMEILRQLGGNKFIMMTGAKNLKSHDHGLSFRIGRNASSTNYVAVALEDNDTYSMIFSKISVSRKTFEVKNKINAEIGGVYCDQLQSIFTNQTGMATRLF